MTTPVPVYFRIDIRRAADSGGIANIRRRSRIRPFLPHCADGRGLEDLRRRGLLDERQGAARRRRQVPHRSPAPPPARGPSAMAGRGHTEAEILAELRRIDPVDCTPA